jgi:hypothetical protein
LVVCKAKIAVKTHIGQKKNIIREYHVTTEEGRPVVFGIEPGKQPAFIQKEKLNTVNLEGSDLRVSEVGFGGRPIIPLPTKEVVPIVKYCFD